LIEFRGFRIEPPPATRSLHRRPGASETVTRLAAGLALLFTLAGCVAAGEYEDPGWRYAVIVGVGRHAYLAATAGQDCSGSLRPDAPYVVARYHDGQHSRSIGKSQRPADSSLQVGQEVRVNILDCNAAFIPLDGRRGLP
jgi:hypothetical protein